MWLDKLKELKKETGMSVKQIAEATNLPERTVTRVFSGDTDNPYVDTLHRIVSVLGGSLDSILTDTKVVVGDESLITLQTEIDRLNCENSHLVAENIMLKDNAATLTAEIDALKMSLNHKEEIIAHKDEIIALHNYYNKIKNQ